MKPPANSVPFFADKRTIAVILHPQQPSKVTVTNNSSF